MSGKNEKINAWMQVGVSIVLLIVGLLILTAPNLTFPHAFPDSTQKLAAGRVGAVIGYWLS